MKILILSTIIILCFSLKLSANENMCKKFDIICKSKNYVKDTKEFQKKEWEKGKKQIKGTINTIPKKSK